MVEGAIVNVAFWHVVPDHGEVQLHVNLLTPSWHVPPLLHGFG